jgi:asparagine synthase (glutamine-hydrolysing)
MCGISGLLYTDPARTVDAHVVERMRAVAKHRGPDDSGIYLDANVGFGFNRLSIIDLSGGHQPMSNEDGSATIIFNGEIYNFQEIQRDLSSRGHRFRTHSDTEVILRAWEEYGENCVTHLRGMFAFAIWDSRRKLLFAARDRIGIKPFYYYFDGEQFVFASEIKSLLEAPGIAREIDTAALADYLYHGYVPAPHTLLRGIWKLPPAHSIVVQPPNHRIKSYWEMPLDGPSPVNERDALEEFGNLIQETLRLHLISDVPLGAFLSGGIDSSSVVALMRRVGVQDIETFSIGYDSTESELGYAKLVADRYHTDHYELRLTPSGFRDILPKIVWHMDEPVADAPSIPLYYLSQFARQRVTVALSGEGSDEIFSGYNIYNIMLAFEKANRIPFARAAGALAERRARKYGSMLGQPLESRYGGVSRIFPLHAVSRLLSLRTSAADPHGSLAAAYARCRRLPALLRMSYIDLTTWLPDDLLVKADRMSMANSLELRVPFLDHKVVEFASRLPLDLRIRGKVNKYLLKRFMTPYLPPEIVHREKKGFPVPKKTWFRTDLAGFARETLLATEGASRQFFPAREIEGILRAHQRRDCSDQIYALLVFDEWYRAFSRPERLADIPVPAAIETQ